MLIKTRTHFIHPRIPMDGTKKQMWVTQFCDQFIHCTIYFSHVTQ
jgi:hypothetical protein